MTTDNNLFNLCGVVVYPPEAMAVFTYAAYAHPTNPHTVSDHSIPFLLDFSSNSARFSYSTDNLSPTLTYTYDASARFSWLSRDPIGEDDQREISISFGSQSSHSACPLPGCGEGDSLRSLLRSFLIGDYVIREIVFQPLYVFAGNEPVSMIDIHGLMCVPSRCSESFKIKSIQSLSIKVTGRKGKCGVWSEPSDEELAQTVKDAYYESMKKNPETKGCEGEDPEGCPCKCLDMKDVTGTLQLDEDASSKKLTCTVFYHIKGEAEVEGKLGTCKGQPKLK